jgi:hypothetical protein
MVPPSRKTREEGELLRIYSSLIYHNTLPKILNHLLCCLLYFTTSVSNELYHNKESTQGDTIAQVWLAHHDLGVVDYKAITGLSLLQVPHFRARRGASLKDSKPDTTSVSKAKCFPISR